MRAHLASFLLPSLLLATSVLVAQDQYSVHGVVVDTTGAAISGALVDLRTSTGKSVASTYSDARGQFDLTRLSGGNFVLVVPAFSGFAAGRMPVKIGANIGDLKMTLKADSVSQEVNVAADEGLSTDSSANRDAVVITGDSLKKMPVFDQDYIAAITPFLDSASGSSGGVTLIVDGVEVKSLGVSPSAVQEVRINNDPYSAEYARPGRGRIDVTTKPGSRVFHGEANFTFRDAIFNAKNHFAVVRPPEVRRIYEGYITGPVGRGGHTNFMASASRREQDIAVIVNAVGPAGAILANVLAPRRNGQASLRVTHDFSPLNRLSLGYSYEGGSTANAGVGGLVLVEAGYNTTSREDRFTLVQRLILTPNLINQFQLTLEKDEDVSVSVTNAQSVQVSGSFVGGGAQADQARTENTVHVNEILTWSHGRHYLRAGVQLPQFSRRGVDDHTNRMGTFQFASLANYNSATPYVFTQQQGAGRAVYWINEFGAFAEDQVKLSKKLQVTLGVRYDWQTFLPDNNNLSPRLSAAYAPDKGRTIVRAGFGLFYDRTGGDFPATVKLHDGVTLHSVQLQNPSYPLPAGANLSATPTNLVRFASNIVAPYSLQYSLGVERQIHKKATLSVGYRGSVMVKSFRSRDANAPVLPPNPLVTATYARPDTNYGQIQQIESGGRGMLNAMDVSFRGQAGRVFSGQAQYTLARFYNNTSGLSSFPQDQSRPNAEWGRASTDQLHRFNLIGTINPDHWLSLGVAATLYSGAPYNETTGTDNYHTGLGNSRPAGVGRNALQGSGVASLDLLYNHEFRVGRAKGDKAKYLSGGVSAFNVLNRTNYGSYIGTLTSSLYGQPTTALAGRQIQFSLGYRF